MLDKKVAQHIIDGGRLVRCCAFPCFVSMWSSCLLSILQEIPASFSPALKDLVQQCWAMDPAQRPSMEKVLVLLEKIKKEGCALA